MFIVENDRGEVLIRKRTEKGLLSGLYEFPWNDDGAVFDGVVDMKKSVTHVFTHIKLTLNIYKLKSNMELTPGSIFVRPENLSDYPLSTLMKKVCHAYQKNPRRP